MAGMGGKSGSSSDDWSGSLGDETRLEMIARIAKDLMKRNFAPDVEELDLDSWGFDDD